MSEVEFIGIEQGNHYQLTFPVYEKELKFIHVYASTPGYTVQYFSNTSLSGTPFLQRIQNNLV